MTQKDQVVEALLQNGGCASFAELSRLVDCSLWKTKTPSASIRRIVQQDSKLFYRILPGLWGLKAMRPQIEARGVDSKSTEYTHSYYQGLLVEIGNLMDFDTYVPPQDKNKPYLNKKLCDVATLPKIYDFADEDILRKARTVDTIWFNCRKMPQSFFEVEHTTNIQNSLDKFYELQDFNAKFKIVSSAPNENRFNDLMCNSRYRDIKRRVEFYSYDKLVKLHDSEVIAASNKM